MTASEENRRIGTRFGPYKLQSLLGRGGMGEVFVAYDTGKDRTVALKLLPESLAADPVYQERFRRESQAAARLQEPHIIPIHDWGEIDGVLFIDMRLVTGSDLRALLGRDGALPASRAVALVSQVASALDAAHADGLVHRDVKPENILVTGDDFVYLVDFGIATSALDSNLTVAGGAVGSYSYMAPERFSDEPATASADTYSLACVLYECLTGAKPYSSKSMVSLIAAHLNAPAPRPSATTGVSSALDGVIAAGLAKTPAGRPASTGEFARAARAALDQTAGSGDITTIVTSSARDDELTQVRPVALQKDHEVTTLRTPIGADDEVTALRVPVMAEPTVVRAAQGPAGYGAPGYPPQYSLLSGPPHGYSPRAAGISIIGKILIALVLAAIAFVVVVAIGNVLMHRDDPPLGVVSPTTTAGRPDIPARDGYPATTDAPPPARAAPPTQARLCPPNHGPGGGYSFSYAGSDMTTCPFSEEVRRAYAGSGPPGQARMISAHSPVTRIIYPMMCTADRGLVMCTGGDNAVVYVV